jgi:hypothetical protein
MIEVWEAMGRMLTDEEFREAILGANVSKRAQPDEYGSWAILEQDYNTMLKAVRTRMDGPVSLMALGELIVALTYDNFGQSVRNLFHEICETHVRIDDCDPQFYVALGAIAIDPILRAKLLVEQENHAQFDANGFKRVCDADRRALLEIFRQGNNDMDAAIADFLVPWQIECYLRYCYFLGHKQPMPESYKYSAKHSAAASSQGADPIAL